MTLSIAFWVLMLLYLVLGGWWWWPAVPPANSPASWRPFGGHLFLWLLLLILGWATFGAIIK